jgi:hypothetical protein
MIHYHGLTHYVNLSLAQFNPSFFWLCLTKNLPHHWFELTTQKHYLKAWMFHFHRLKSTCLLIELKRFIRVNPIPILLQPHFGLSVRVKPTLPKVGTWSPPGLLKIQSSSWRAKTPCIGAFLVSLERSWSEDVQTGLALAIWTSSAQVMGKRRAGSQTGNLTPDHKKLGIYLFPTSAVGVRHGVGKLLTRATILIQSSSRSEFGTRSYERPKS